MKAGPRSQPQSSALSLQPHRLLATPPVWCYQLDFLQERDEVTMLGPNLPKRVERCLYSFSPFVFFFTQMETQEAHGKKEEYKVVGM
ncbi:hypothetical protein NDU88_008841 [Pleurodeles waltl]|uniref:Uncharacterized protein n=1 Tax=Pleurodeles waltl TaxID=8319 RepID=A0AAV7QPS4_PLEWA|nr:hypothetical protein NDU88_008841 [Pleurodeles waltl]